MKEPSWAKYFLKLVSLSEVVLIGIGCQASRRTIFGDGGRSAKLAIKKLLAEEQDMSTVALVDRKMNEIIKLVETDRVQWTIDQLMRNRDPRLFVAREVKVSDKA